MMRGIHITRKKQTKKDLDKKIAELEAKLSKLTTELEAKPAETITKPKDTILPQSFESKENTKEKYCYCQTKNY